MINNKGNIIILNGVSSSGKTTISKALQKGIDEHYFWVANDSFCEMCSETHWRQDWVVAINLALKALAYSVKQMSDLGINIIVDQVFLNNESQNRILHEFVTILYNYPILFVRVDSSLEDLRKREVERGNRRIGQAESQLDIVHNHELYDIVINTSTTGLDENIELLKSAILNISDSTAFKMLYKKFLNTGTVY